MSALVVELFAGAGGASLGIAAAGWDAVGIEIDRDACATRRAAGLDTIRADVATYPAGHLRGVAGIWSSAPCTDFSVAGRQLGLEGHTGHLVYEVLRWATALRPQWIACENVPRVKPIFRQIRDELVPLGYSAWVGILDAADYGVPQQRRRAILMASLAAVVCPPPATHCAQPQQRMDGPALKPHVSMAQALGWGMEEPTPTVCGHRQPAWVYGARGPGHGRSDHFSAEEPSRSVGATTGKSSWLVSSDLTFATWGGERPATTVQSTPCIAAAGHHRRQWADATPVTLEELATLQGFRPGYPFVGNKTSVARQIGNAVPAALAEAVVRAVAAAQ